MKKLLIGLSTLVVLLLGGCATSSTPSPKVSSDDESHEKFSTKAVEYKKACDGNNAKACRLLSELYVHGKGVKQDFSKARNYSNKACDLNDGAGCNYSGIIYLKVNQYKWLGPFYSMEGNYWIAAKYFGKACKLNHNSGCTNFGASYANGKGVKRDYSKARKYYKKACDLNDNVGCSNLGLSYTKEKYGETDYSKAKKYLRKGCDLGDSTGCEEYKKLKRQGH